MHSTTSAARLRSSPSIRTQSTRSLTPCSCSASGPGTRLRPLASSVSCDADSPRSQRRWPVGHALAPSCSNGPNHRSHRVTGSPRWCTWPVVCPPWDVSARSRTASPGTTHAAAARTSSCARLAGSRSRTRPSSPKTFYRSSRAFLSGPSTPRLLRTPRPSTGRRSGDAGRYLPSDCVGGRELAGPTGSVNAASAQYGPSHASRREVPLIATHEGLGGAMQDDLLPTPS